MKRLLGILFLIFVILTSCTAKYLNKRSFETVWRTVNEKHFDSSFGGLDWKAIHDRYEPQIAAAETDSEFYEIVNNMLFELNLSHLLVASQEDLKVFMPTLFAKGSLGVDVRLINGATVVTSAKPGSPAAKAGLRPGFVIQGIDGLTMEEIISQAEKKLIPPFNSQNRRNNITLQILGRIYGPPGTTVSIAYLDGEGKNQERTIERKSRGRGEVISEAMPPFFIEFEAKQLEDNIGYVWFNHFAKPVDKKFIAALESMRDAPGLIIDLRGTTGGFINTVDKIARHLLLEETRFSTFKFRGKTIHRTLGPVKSAYKGQLVVLMDVLSMSSSEYFASSLQEIGRAVVVGERSPGYLLIANWMKLINGAAFMHTVAQSRTPTGRIIEGHGVVPDIEVEVDHDLLMQGHDTQLDQAIDWIKNQVKK